MPSPWFTRGAGGAARKALHALRADGTVLLSAVFLVTGAMGLWLKMAQLELSSGYLATARFLGYSRESDLAWWQKLSFFRLDLAIMMVAIPVLLALVLRALPRVTRATFAGLLGATLCAVYFFELQALGSIGRYLTPELVTDALSWAVDFPESIGDYISAGGMLKLLAAIGVIVWLAVLAARRSGSGRAGALVRFTEVGAIVGLACGVLLSLLAFAMPVPTLVSHRSALQSAGDAIWPGRNSFGLSADASREELLELYRRAAALPGEPSTDVTRGLDAGHDVLVFIMETGPSRSYDPLRDRESLPGVSALLDRSFVARKHLTTYPYTTDAIFSILTGLYPLGRSSFLRDDRPLGNAGLLPPLDPLGYLGLVYLPYPDSFENDTRMYAIAGVSETYIADDIDAERKERAAARAERTISLLPERSPARIDRRDLLADRLTHDYMALDALCEGIVKHKRGGQRFVAFFVPQIGHAPWFDLYGKEEVVERGRDVMILQDEWLAEIVSLLEDNGWLHETVIVLTSDHGIRTRVEDPALESGTISGYSFDVPLVVFAPGTLQNMRVIDAHTSHIDIAPTVHSLLGSSYDRGFVTQGVPIMEEERLAQRRAFMFAAGYLGADGYTYRDKYVARKTLNGFLHQSDTLEAGAGTLVRDEDLAARLAEPIDLMYALQPQLLQSLRAADP